MKEQDRFMQTNTTHRKLCSWEGCNNLATSQGIKRRGSGIADGSKYYGRWCSTHKKNRHKNIIKTKCELCGFVAVDKVQLDIDHIDGDKTNNEESNLQVLCANCHRLKTIRSKDHMPF